MDDGKKMKTSKISRSTLKPSSWLNLPPELLEKIMRKLGPVGILETAQKVCTTWRRACHDPSLWRVLDTRLLHAAFYPDYLEAICRRIVDLSQGQLVEVHIDFYCRKKLLDYIAQRSSQLKHLEIKIRYYAGTRGLIEAVKQFPLLEEIHLFLTHVSENVVKEIGVSCPLLESFSFSCKDQPNEDDAVALAVAKYMPGLRHLGLVNDALSNKGLEAIMVGCPLLESLDIRGCLNIDLSGDLGERCYQQVKHLRKPKELVLYGEWPFSSDDEQDWGNYCDYCSSTSDSDKGGGGEWLYEYGLI